MFEDILLADGEQSEVRYGVGKVHRDHLRSGLVSSGEKFGINSKCKGII